jgi:hypothetical protein
MTELGQTADPKALIPGDADAIESRAQLLSQHGQTWDRVGSDLKKIDPTSWTGQASAAFREKFSQEPPKWLKGSDLLKDVSKSLTDHANTLRWAQGQASEAIARWQEGEEETKKAVAEYNQAVDQANARNEENAAAGSAARTTVQEFSDPGAEIRQEAQDTLNRARQQLQQAGDRAQAAIVGKDPKAGGGLLGDLVNAVTSGWKGSGKAGASGPGAGLDMSGPNGDSLGEIKAYAKLVSADASGHYGNDLFQLDGSASAQVGAEATASAGWEGNEAKAEADVQAGLTAQADGKFHSGPVTLEGSATGLAGAQANAGVSAGWAALKDYGNKREDGPEIADGVKADASAFAGAKGSVEGGADVGGIGISGSVDGSAGAGVNAGYEFGETKDGDFTVGGNIGAAVGLGAGGEVAVTVDPKEIEENTQKVADAVGSTAGHVASGVGHDASSAAHKVEGWL